MTGLRSFSSDRTRRRRPQKLSLQIRAPGDPPQHAVRALAETRPHSGETSVTDYPFDMKGRI
jgi:hypothetical protein